MAQAQAQAAEYLDNWRRSIAELSNARKRMQREQAEYHPQCGRSACWRSCCRWWTTWTAPSPSCPPDQADSDWVNGFRLIQRKLQGLLDSEGVTTIAAEGQTFDPTLHYAVTHEEAEGVESGSDHRGGRARATGLGDKVLRPSMVRVAQ